VRNRTGDRRVLWLEYEAFPSMAVRQLEAIGAEVAARHGLSALACAHRTGRLEIGEAAVVVAASAPHRRAALEGIEAFLRRLKQDVPIWKKEFFEGGAAWIGSPEDPQALRAAEETAP
jgi:molybdopterin synthase catalytic subunit